MKHSQTKAPEDITCNSQETSNIFGTKHNKHNSAVFAKRQCYFLNEGMKLILPKSRNNISKICKKIKETFMTSALGYFY